MSNCYELKSLILKLLCLELNLHTKKIDYWAKVRALGDLCKRFGQEERPGRLNQEAI